MTTFKKITVANSTEVSLCSKYNSGANKQTQFEIVKDKETEEKLDLKPVLKKLVNLAEAYDEELADKREDKVEDMEEPSILQEFEDFLNYWLEYDLNDCMYNLLSESLQNAIYDIAKDHDYTKEEKVGLYQQLFNTFVEEYKRLPITKTADNKYEVSLVSKSHIQDNGTNPQSETTDITKEKTSEMEHEEQKTAIQKAIEILTSVFSLKKTETPADETPEVKPEGQPEAEKPTETEEVETEVKPAEVEAPVVEEADKTVEPNAEPNAEKAEDEPSDEPTDDKPADKPEDVTEPVEKSSEPSELETVLKQKLDLEKELADIKKAQAEKEEAIAKMSYVQKAKDEYSMLVGTPEEIGAKLYDISKSNLTDDSKTFILDQLKKVAKENQELTKEVGSMTKNSDLTPEEEVYAKAEEIAKSKGISINKALRQVK